jgi:branched-chain amino acid transport system substrate-binding protein
MEIPRRTHRSQPHGGRRGGRGRAAGATVALITSALALAACGSHHSSNGASGGAAQPTLSAASASAVGTGPKVNVAVVESETGPTADDGVLSIDGAELAAANINAAGGIKALGGAQINVVVQDEGATPANATSAMQAVLGHGGITGCLGGQNSAQTLAFMPVLATDKVPCLTLSAADQVTTSGNKYIFRDVATAGDETSVVPQFLIDAAKAVGHTIKSVALVSDNGAPEENLIGFKKAFPAAGVKVGYTNVWTSPLPDPTTLAQSIIAAHPDMVYTGASNLDDLISLRRALIALGYKGLMFGIGVPNANPAFQQAVGKTDTNDFVAVVPGAPVKGMSDIAAQFQAQYHQPFGPDASILYAQMYLLAQAIENAKSTDAVAVRDALSKLSLNGGAARYIAGAKVDFDDGGQNIHAEPIIAQWQGGTPVTVYPTDQATSKLEFPS